MTRPEFERGRVLPSIAGVWAVLESTVFFVLPDFFVAPAVIARPRQALRLVAATILGSVIGMLALAALVASYPEQTRNLIVALPFTGEEMFASVAGRTDDAAAVATQPVSGIPAKVWTWTAVSTGSPLLAFFALLSVARLCRFAAVAGGAWLLERALGSWMRRHARPLLAIYLLGFFAGLWLVSR